MTVVMAEHEVEVMAAYADQIVVMHEGEILLNGKPEDVFSDAALIKKLGLRMPQVAEFAYKIEELGIKQFNHRYPTTLEKAVTEFRELFENHE